MEETEYDLVVSLGGNCSAAHNLRFRNLRPFSMPFDWVYCADDRPVRFWLEKCDSGFEGMLLKENLTEIRPGDKEYASAHADVRQYIDAGTGYRWVNHFRKSIDEPGEYERVYRTISRRAKRLTDAFAAGGRFLLLLAMAVDVETELLEALVRKLSAAYPQSVFELRYLHFGRRDESIAKIGEAITVQNIVRPQNDYDFLQTNWEWSFLDGVRLSDRYRPRRGGARRTLNRIRRLLCTLGWRHD